MIDEMTGPKEIKQFKEKPCDFCQSRDIRAFMDKDDYESLGKIYKYGGITTHYYCLLFASKLSQNGEDDEGIFGFFPKDIRMELRRTKELKCKYCLRKGASIECDECNTKFHLPCGIRNNSLHQFFGGFKSFCRLHRCRQTVLPRYLKNKLQVDCIICFEKVKAKPTVDVLWAPCCKTTWLHRSCAQKMALHTGYHFKCPKCNDKPIFRIEMRQYGIHIPDQDGSWEMVPDAFIELNQRYNACDSQPCQCQAGRNYSTNDGDWQIILCNICGSHGTHQKCRRIASINDHKWVCELCSKVNDAVNESRKSNNEASVTSDDSDDVDLHENNVNSRPTENTSTSSSPRLNTPSPDGMDDSDFTNRCLRDLTFRCQDVETTNKKRKLESSFTNTEETIFVVEDNDDDVIFVNHEIGSSKQNRVSYAADSTAKIRFHENGKIVEMSATSVKRDASDANAVTANSKIWRSVSVEESILRRHYRSQSYQTTSSNVNAGTIASSSTDDVTDIDEFMEPDPDVIIIDD